MINKLFLPFGLVFLAVFSGLPGVSFASSRFTPLEKQPQGVAIPAAGLPAQSLDTGTRSQPGNQPTETPSKPILHFDRLSAADGMSFSLAITILQDQRGFMWFGTRYGLNKYDGFNFTVYNLTPSGPDPMFGNAIQSLYQDRTGDLWVGTYLDLVRRDMKTGAFVHYKYDAANPKSLGAGDINTIGEDADGVLWVGTNSGLSRFDRSTDTFTRFSQNQAIRKIYRDRQGEVWVGTYSGLWRFEPASPGQQGPAINRYGLDGEVITAIHADRQGALWVGTALGGLIRLDRATGEFARFNNNQLDPTTLSDNYVSSILEDGSGRLWVGTNTGLNLFDPTTGGFFHYNNDPDDPHSLSNDAVLDLYQDRSGVVWIATPAGINKVNENASRFIHYQKLSNQPAGAAGVQPKSVLEPRNPPGLSENMLEAVYEDSHGILWIGTIGSGLNRLDRSTGTVTVYRHDPTDPSSLSGDEVVAIYEDQAGTLWIGSNNGLDRFIPQTEKFDYMGAFRDWLVSTIAEDQQGNLWVGYWGGLLRRKSGASTFTVVPVLGEMVHHYRVNKVYPDRTGAIWVSTQDNGLFRLDPTTDTEGVTPTVTHFALDASDPNGLGAGPVMSFYEDAQGTLWIGSMMDGLIRFDRGTQTFIHYLPNTGTEKYVSCIQGDEQGFLWVGTKLGLARFDPRTATFLYFDARDGLMVGETLACFQNKQGEMFFGGLQGLDTFFPNQVRDNPNPPPVVITTLNLKNQALRTDLSPDEQIKLSYQENYLSFDFTSLDYAAPSKNQYAYKMEGLDAAWIEAGTRRHADYPDLKPGSYTFRVKATNNSGVWNEQGTAVRITITPPFWQTWWFLGLLGLALVGVIAVGFRLRIKGVEARSRELEKQVGERTGALEQKTLELALRTLETEQRRQELEALLSADDRMQRYLHQDQVLQALVDVAVDMLQADKSAVIWWDENREKLVMRVARGFSPKAVSQFQFTPGEGVVGGVALRGEPVLVEDSLTDPRRLLENPQIVKIANDEGIRSFMFFPILIGDEVQGIFNVSFEKTHAAGAEEQRLFQALTQRAALYIENARLYEQSQELAVLEERSRLARELHDAVTQTLFSASLVAEALPATWEKDPEEGRGLLQELRGLSRGALAEMRTLLLELRPAALAETPLADLLRQLGEAASGREGIPVSVQVEGQASKFVPPLPSDVQITFYRIAQEALNNIVKHARAQHVTVRLCYSCPDPIASPKMTGDFEPPTGFDTLSSNRRSKHPEPVEAGQSVLLSVCDDGRGFDPTRIPHNRLGLGFMQERARAIGASLTVESQPGQGTQVTVLWEQERKQEAK